ncbi:MAG: hypothetical protein NW224_07430 [Leptolyngbyaceae cyanobacterium bins.302]|nr:hypothetical protein [Leptolyngbyaceae cyanobacterium bins.302]
MSLSTDASKSQASSSKPESSVSQPSPQASPSSKVSIESPSSTKVTFEVPTNSSLPVNPFDPSWIKLWEQVGPISYLALLCTFIWLLTRLVETVKGK